jgi:leader peptidase (prepilin peptidase)/N-methyltransferase
MPLLRGAIGMAALYLFYFVLRLVRPDGMGGGDVKLAGVLGLYLGFVGWGALAVGAFAAFVFGGLYGVALIVLRRAGRKSAIPFGPWMILGAWVGLVAGESVARWYVGMFAQ